MIDPTRQAGIPPDSNGSRGVLLSQDRQRGPQQMAENNYFHQASSSTTTLQPTAVQWETPELPLRSDWDRNVSIAAPVQVEVQDRDLDEDPADHLATGTNAIFHGVP